MRNNSAFRATLIAICASIAGCAPAVPPSQLSGPPKRCMASPERIPKVKAGDDMIAHDAANIEARKREASKTRCLQRYIRTVLK